MMESDTRPDNQRVHYSTMMFYHNIMNSDHKGVAKKILAEQTKSNHKEHHDLKGGTDSKRSRNENKDCGEHEQIQLEKAGERENREVNRRKGKAGNGK